MSCKDWPNDIELGPLGIDYEYFYKCDCNKDYHILAALLLLLWSIYLISILGSTASNYFSPTLANICHRLKLRYDIAGVTLLAFGNGAPDVFSSISSFSGQSGTDSTREAMLVGIGALLGGSVFVTTVVVGSIAIICPCDVSPRYFIRDVCFHMIAASSLAVVSYLGYINIYSGIISLALYIIYVATVFFSTSNTSNTNKSKSTTSNIQTAFWHRKHNNKFRSSVLQNNYMNTKVSESLSNYKFLTLNDSDTKDNYDGTYTINLSGGLNSHEFDGDIVDDYFNSNKSNDNAYTENAINTVPSSTGGRMIPLEIMTEEKDNSLNENLLQDQLIGNNNEFITVNKESNSALYWQQKVLRKRIHRLLFDSEWWDLPFYNQLWVLIESPLTLCRDLTIPTNDKGYWNKYYAMVQPFNCVIFLCFIFGELSSYTLDLPTSVFWLLIAIPIAILVYILTHFNKPPDGLILGFIWNISGFLMCIAWIYTFAKELIVCLTAIGSIFDISPAFLGLTVLAWGNSIGDYVANTAVARRGMGEMAIAGCYGSPIFDIFVGLGISFTYACINSYPQPFIVTLDVSSKLSLLFLYLSLLMTLIIVSSRKFQLDAMCGIFLIILYIIFTICQVILLPFDSK